MPKVLISDKLSESAVDIFKKNKIETIYNPGLSHEDLLKEINNYDGLAIRSATKVTEKVLNNAKNLIKTGDLTSGHARSLLNYDDPINLAHLVVKKGLSVRQTELLTKRKKIETIEKKPILNKKDLNTKELEDTLTAHLKFKVKILCDNKKKSGKVNILFNDNQELEKICNILKKSF